MEKFKVRVIVLKEKSLRTATNHAANGKVFQLPIIPRMGDHLELKTQTSDASSELATYEVKSVYIMNRNAIDAEVHVITDETE